MDGELVYQIEIDNHTLPKTAGLITCYSSYSICYGAVVCILCKS